MRIIIWILNLYPHGADVASPLQPDDKRTWIRYLAVLTSRAVRSSSYEIVCIQRVKECGKDPSRPPSCCPQSLLVMGSWRRKESIAKVIIAVFSNLATSSSWLPSLLLRRTPLGFLLTASLALCCPYSWTETWVPFSLDYDSLHPLSFRCWYCKVFFFTCRFHFLLYSNTNVTNRSLVYLFF